jgi:hypothetical protein
MENKIQGRIISVFPEVGGQGKNGNPWRKQEYLLETADTYPKKIVFLAWGEKIDQFALQQGEQVTVWIDIESREYNGRWYNDIKAWKVEKGQESAAVQPLDERKKMEFSGPPPGEADELPF